MGSNEQPDEPSGRAITIRLNPENIILAAAIVFLLAAVALAVYFSLDTQSQQSAQRPTPATSATPNLAQATVASVPTGIGANGGATYPAPNLPTAVATRPTPANGVAVAPTFAAQPYPGPNEPGAAPTRAAAFPTVANSSANVSPTAPLFAPTIAATVAPTANSAAPVPTFAPSRPTVVTGATGLPIAPTIAQPTFAQPTVAQPTFAQSTALVPTVAPLAPTVAQPTFTPPTPVRTAQPTSPTLSASDAPTAAANADATATAAPPAPNPADLVRGSLRWSPNQSPIILRRDLRITPGSNLLIDPGVEVRLAPGVAIYVEGKLYAAGQPGKPVRFTSSGGGRWDAIYGRPGGDIGLANVEISGGGNGGTLISSEGGNLSIARAQIRDNGGQIRALDSRLELRESDISGNDLPYGSAVDASYSIGGGVTLVGNRIGGNRLADGAASVQVRNESTGDTVSLDAQGNLFENSTGPDMIVFTNGPMRGGLSCNALVGGSAGLMVKSTSPQVAPQVQLNFANNAIENQTPPIIPEFIKYGIGRGASSDLYIDMRNNWWRSDLGPYHPDLHADGRGEAVGANITFAPWLTARPACAPQP